MKIVIDCNVIISAALTDGLCRKVLRWTLQNEEIYLSKDILLEYILVSRREKFKAYQSYIEKLIDLVGQAAQITEANYSTIKLPDPHDKQYIDLALTVNAEFLITGNLADFPDKIYGATTIISPRLFFDYLSTRQKTLLII